MPMIILRQTICVGLASLSPNSLLPLPLHLPLHLPVPSHPCTYPRNYRLTRGYKSKPYPSSMDLHHHCRSYQQPRQHPPSLIFLTTLQRRTIGTIVPLTPHPEEPAPPAPTAPTQLEVEGTVMPLLMPLVMSLVMWVLRRLVRIGVHIWV